jgi:hypothetical protein
LYLKLASKTTRNLFLVGIGGILLFASRSCAQATPSQAGQSTRCTPSTLAEQDKDCSAHGGQGPENGFESREERQKRNLVEAWLRMAEQVQATQPDWLSPLVTTSGRLKQEFRYDTWDQPAAGGNRNYQFGGNKGLEFITSSRTQLLVGVPTYTLVSRNGPPGGFGDLPLMLKVRLASAERAEGNYLLTFILGATAPTGSRRYGAGDAVLTPTLAFGKGWRNFDVQTTVGANLPAGDTARMGRQLQWNTAFQYRAAWKLWPELEANSTFYETGKYAGNKQVFLTPGIGFGRVHMAGRFRFSSAVGMQIAATQFHTYNHRWIFSERFSF